MKLNIAHSRFVILGLSLGLVGLAQAAFTPIPLTTDSFNEDVVVENTATPALVLRTTASVDQGTNNNAATWYEQGFDANNPTWGLPIAGSTFQAQDNSSYSFKMPPDFGAPNGILITTIDTNIGGTFTLTTPAAYSKLSFLSSGGNGGHLIGVTIHHEDATSETGSFSSPDWFNGSGIAWTAGGRMNNTRNFTVQDNGGTNPRIYYRDVPLSNTTSPVTSIDLYFISGNNGANSDVLAVSGAPSAGGNVQPIDVTGYTYDFIVEKESPRRQRIVTDTIVDGTNVWATTQTLENQGNTSWTLYEQGYNINNPGGGGFAPNANAINTGLPSAGSTVSNTLGDHVFVLPPDYSANNACFLTTAITNQTITLATPTTASVLSFLATSGGGAATLDVVVTHEDASTESAVITIPDWFNGAASQVVGANGRVQADTGEFGSVFNNGFPRLNSIDLLVSGASPVTSIELTHRDTGGQVGIFAVSGTTDPTLPGFTTQPESQKVNVAANVTFTAIATANVPITYQWQAGTNNLFVNLAGQTTTTLSRPNVLDQDYPSYRCVATTSAGSVTSSVASLLVISPLQPVTLPGEQAIEAYAPDTTRGYPGGEAPSFAIDGTTSKYLHFGNNPIGRLGFIVAPSQGRSIVSAMRLTAANDDFNRDPVVVILEGSEDAGATYTLIYSNSVSLPDARNAGGQPLAPITQSIAQVRFENTNSYTSYRWYTTQLKGNVDLMQIGEVELLGVIDYSDPSPYFITHPVSQTVYEQGSASFNVFAFGIPSPDYTWQKGANGVFTDLADGGGISGSQTDTLTVSPAMFSDAAQYRCMASNTEGSVPSAVVTLTVISTNVDVTVPTDPISSFGDESGTQHGAAAGATNTIDNANTLIYINGGSGLNAAAGFPPFQGPVGVVVTPAVGYTRLSGLRIYTSTDGTGRDPINYSVEGSNDGGNSYTMISQGDLNLPLARGNNDFAFDPIQQPLQEILFTSPNNFATYKVSFMNTRDDANQSALSIGELELLGVPSGPPVAEPVLSIAPNGEGGFVISSTEAGNVYSTTNLASPDWVLEGPTPLTVTPQPTDTEKYFQIR